jgi:hypothetical protein
MHYATCITLITLIYKISLFAASRNEMCQFLCKLRCWTAKITNDGFIKTSCNSRCLLHITLQCSCMQKIEMPVPYEETHSNQYIQLILTPLSIIQVNPHSYLDFNVNLWNQLKLQEKYVLYLQAQSGLYTIQMCKYEIRRYSPHLCHGSSSMLLNMSSDGRKYLKWRYVI